MNRVSDFICSFVVVIEEMPGATRESSGLDTIHEVTESSSYQDSQPVAADSLGVSLSQAEGSIPLNQPSSEPQPTVNYEPVTMIQMSAFPCLLS